jgi:hypothetical protein
VCPMGILQLVSLGVHRTFGLSISLFDKVDISCRWR